MDKNLRAQVLETYNIYLNAINEADLETINDEKSQRFENIKDCKMLI